MMDTGFKMKNRDETGETLAAMVLRRQRRRKRKEEFTANQPSRPLRRVTKNAAVFAGLRHAREGTQRRGGFKKSALAITESPHGFPRATPETRCMFMANFSSRRSVQRTRGEGMRKWNA